MKDKFSAALLTHLSKNVVTVLENIENKGKEVFNWFSINYLKANPDNSQLLLTSKDEAFIKIGDTDIKSSSSKKLLARDFNRLYSLLTNMFLSFAKKYVTNDMLWVGFQNILLKTNLEL